MKETFEYYRSLENTDWIEKAKQQLGEYKKTIESKKELKEAINKLFDHTDIPPGIEFEQLPFINFNFDMSIYETHFEVLIPAISDNYELVLMTPKSFPLSEDKVYLGELFEARGMGDTQLLITNEFDSLDQLLKFAFYVRENYKSIKQ